MTMNYTRAQPADAFVKKPHTSSAAKDNPADTSTTPCSHADAFYFIVHVTVQCCMLKGAPESWRRCCRCLAWQSCASSNSQGTTQREYLRCARACSHGAAGIAQRHARPLCAGLDGLAVSLPPQSSPLSRLHIANRLTRVNNKATRSRALIATLSMLEFGMSAWLRQRV